MKVAPKDAEALGAAPAGGGFIALSALLRSLCPCPRAHAAVDTAHPKLGVLVRVGESGKNRQQNAGISAVVHKTVIYCVLFL